MNSYNRLRDDSEINKYYKSVLSDLKTKRFKCQQKSKLPFLDEEISKIEALIKKLDNETTE